MNPGQTVQHALLVLVAELVLGDQRHEKKTHHDGQHQDPHQGVAVLRARGNRIDDVAAEVAGVEELGMISRGEDAEITSYLNETLVSNLRVNTRELA